MLTVAVSVAAGVFAITSAAPSLASHQLALSLACVALLTVGNLRGVRESGLLFAFPTYGFIAMLYLTLGIGVAKCTVGIVSGRDRAAPARGRNRRARRCSSC